MKKNVLALVPLLAAVANIHAATLFSDSFSNPNGNLVGQGSWLQNGASVVNPIQVTAGEVGMLATGQDVNAALSSPFSLVDGTSFYIGSTINISAASAVGDYFLHWSPATSSTVFVSRLHVRSSGGGFQLGYLETASGGSLTWGSTVLNLNQDYRVVVAYNVLAGALNDTADVYVNPTDFAVQANNTPYLTDAAWSSTLAETTTLGAVNLRQGGSTTGATLSVDDLYVATTFAEMEVVPEPTSLALVAIGAGAAMLRRRKA